MSERDKTRPYDYALDEVEKLAPQGRDPLTAIGLDLDKLGYDYGARWRYVEESDHSYRQAVIERIGSAKTMPACVLLKDGSMFGPFADRAEAITWCNTNCHAWFSTYDLRKP